MKSIYIHNNPPGLFPGSRTPGLIGLRVIQEYLKEVQRVFQGSFKDFLRKFHGCLKKVSSVFQENLMKNFKGVSRIFQWSFALQFCHSMNLIAATRAEGGLVSRGGGSNLFLQTKKNGFSATTCGLQLVIKYGKKEEKKLNLLKKWYTQNNCMCTNLYSFR